MNPAARIETDELVILHELVPLAGQDVIELGCGSARLARALTMHVLVEMEREGTAVLDALIDKLTARPEVQAAWYVTGDTDLILYVVVPTMEAYEVFTREMLNDDARVRAFKTLISIREVLPFDPARRALAR